MPSTSSTDPASTFDTVLSVYDACGGTEIACNEDIGIGNVQSEVAVALTAGTTYIIVVDGVLGSVREPLLAEGDITLEITR